MDRDWQNEVLGFSFADTWVLGLLPLILLLWWWRVTRRSAAVGFASVDLLDRLPQSLRARLAKLPLHLFALGLLPVLMALGRPQRLTRLPVQGEGLDIMLCLDISSSMHVIDMDRKRGMNRLEVAKEVATDFLRGRLNDRVGLVVFARYPDLICPMTLDKQALKRFLEPIEFVKIAEEDGTAIGLGLGLCIKQLEKSKAKSRVVILLTDGQENVNEITPADAGKLAKDAEIRVYAIGVGQGERTLLNQYRAIDFDEIEQVAEMTGAKFYKAVDKDALDSVFARIDELEKSKLEDPLYIAEELYFPFLALGAVFVFLSFLLRVVWIVEVP